ncbi:ATP-binding protein [Limosilactobacillus reuteri]|uniref:ATP-binding protein n=1 Tax=Limosilactobacillus reuteri TaxID=1598 RepID=UPI001E414A9F|nr:ATP-binding protein [Limosilactobacillus reuteri]MCC4384133.1 ATP-binding protein [Limosilactobacillus reuteri]MCC4419975.1 ATP-binding protein [Limosilactobacillus reuteri]MCC4421287.1 ATP-binding protein [Limosilactobacillus reuteri]
MESLGVIVGVDGDISQVGMYNMSNETSYLWDGELVAAPKVGAFLTINQNDIKIIATVVSEKIMDQQNTVKSKQFDNRYSPSSINRIILLKTQGVIENSRFKLTSRYVPMIGNEVIITTSSELRIIYGIDSNEPTISIGESVREGERIYLPINKFFASHIGIFGNTGSGKSNTLHKLYLELFKSQYKEQIFEKSKFFVIDFNGEYTQENQFGVNKNYRKVFNINTRSSGDKIPITKEYLFNPDILAILFDARPATQIPFLRSAMRKYKEIHSAQDFSNIEIGLLKSLLLNFKSIEFRALEEWTEIVNSIGVKSYFLDELGSINNYGNLEIFNGSYNLLKEGRLTNEGNEILKQINEKLNYCYGRLSEISKLRIFLQFQRIYVSAWKSTNIEFLNPLFKRIEVALNSLEPIIKLIEKNEIGDVFKCLNVINLINSNQEIKRVVPMMLSKMIYDEQKQVYSTNKRIGTCHLIIDEAHNILNSEYRNNGDSWQDYRLSVFEEIIKEGRKFGFFLTLSSQRPADISPTIISQLHNFFIHRLVNDNDLQMLANTMPTLDRNSYKEISSLGQGEAVVTGNAMKVPALLKVDKEKHVRPKSDDLILTDLWSSNNENELPF